MKKLISRVNRMVTRALIVGLAAALLLNVSTLWSVHAIQRGGTVDSGFFCAIVGSGSMEPTIAIQDMLFIRGAKAYRMDDIVTYVSPRGTLVTHRITGISDDGYITQGDANNIPDEAVAGQRVLGRVWLVVPRVGGIINGMLSPVGLALGASVVLLVWLIQRMRRDQNEAKGDEGKRLAEGGAGH